MNAPVSGWGKRGIVYHEVGAQPMRSWVKRMALDGPAELLIQAEPGPDTIAFGGDAVGVRSIALPQAFLDADTRVAEPPGWRFDWVPWLYVVVAAAVIGVVWWVRRVRRH